MSSGADKSKNGGYDWIDCGAKIDFLYVSPDIKVETYETFADPRPGKKCYHSDHFPIVCDIKLSHLSSLIPHLTGICNIFRFPSFRYFGRMLSNNG